MPVQSSYSVELKKSGKTLSVEPGLSLLDVLLEAGCDIDHSLSRRGLRLL